MTLCILNKPLFWFRQCFIQVANLVFTPFFLFDKVQSVFSVSVHIPIIPPQTQFVLLTAVTAIAEIEVGECFQAS